MTSLPGAHASGLVRAAGRPESVVAFEESVVSFFLDAADVFGVPKSVAAIYGICFASVEPLSFADIGDRLEISQGSISQGLRVLREMGALRVVDQEKAAGMRGKTGEMPACERRREFFAPDLELRQVASRFLEERLENHLKSGRPRLQTMRAMIPADDSRAAKEFRVRLKSLQNWHDKARAVLPVMKTFLKLV